jgi:hypothetical protein
MKGPRHTRKCAFSILRSIIACVLLALLAGTHGAAAKATTAAASTAAAGDTTAAAESPPAASAAAVTAPEFAWLERYVASKCFAPADAQWQLDDSSKETVLHRETQFFGVYEQPEGFYYHYSTSTRQTEFALTNGVKTQAAKVCNMGARASASVTSG